MSHWLTPAVIAFVCWGLWAFLPKVVTQHISPNSALIYEIIGAIIVALILLVSMDLKVEFHPRASALAVITGMLGMLGSLAYLYAVSRGPVSVMSVITALYPIFTLIIAYIILHEPISIKQGIGMVFALLAIVLIAS